MGQTIKDEPSNQCVIVLKNRYTGDLDPDSDFTDLDSEILSVRNGGGRNKIYRGQNNINIKLLEDLQQSSGQTIKDEPSNQCVIVLKNRYMGDLDPNSDFTDLDSEILNVRNGGGRNKIYRSQNDINIKLLKNLQQSSGSNY